MNPDNDTVTNICDVILEDDSEVTAVQFLGGPELIVSIDGISIAGGHHRATWGHIRAYLTHAFAQLEREGNAVQA